MTITAAGVTELAAQECATAWLVLLTISHPSLPTPLRFTSDGVTTISNSQTYQSFPFEITLPDDVEGRAPRGLTSPPTVAMQIVRSAAPNVVEREWIGLEWRASTYDVGFITGQLTVDDIATEEFPYITFDGRFRALWP